MEQDQVSGRVSVLCLYAAYVANVLWKPPEIVCDCYEVLT